MEIAGFFAELKRRRVIRAIIGYGVAAFAILQVVEPVMHGLHWPDAVLSYTVVGLALGFPLTVALAWIFDVRDGRIERDRTGPGGVRLAAVIAIVGAIAAVPGVVYWFAFRAPLRAAPAGPPSIAVLPFANLSRDADNEYFSDGLTEELINALANVEGLRVASRTSVFALKGQQMIADQIGARLGVGLLLEGSVRREGNALRVTAQLINAADGYHLWSKTYDRELKGIFAVEDEIARSVAEALRRTLTAGVKAQTGDAEAHDLYLKGRFFWNQRTAEAFRTARGLFEKAIARDPQYALAWAGLADSISIRLDYERVDAGQVIAEARKAAQRALELDPSLAEAHTASANLAWHELDWATAERELRKSIELRPDYATAHQWLAELLMDVGRLPEARAEIARAVQADPTSPIIQVVAGAAEMRSLNFDAALAQYQRALELDPSFDQARWLTIAALVLKGEPAKARKVLDEVRTKADADRLLETAWLDAVEGRRERALAVLRELDGRIQPDETAKVWLALGDRDRAMAQLERGCAERASGVLGVKTAPFLRPLQTHPRWPELMKCLHLD